MSSSYFWLSDDQFGRIKPHLPTDTRRLATYLIGLVAVCSLAGCYNKHTEYGIVVCEAFGCVTHGEIAPRLDGTIIGKSTGTALSVGGLPTDRYTDDDGVEHLSWERTFIVSRRRGWTSSVPNDGRLTCTEYVTVNEGMIATYRFYGHCMPPDGRL